MDIWDKIDQQIGKINLQSTSYQNNTKESKQTKQTKEYQNKIIVNINRNGTYVDNLDSQLSKKIKSYYTLRDRTIMGYDKITNNYEQKGTKLYIPRFGAFLLQNKFKNIEFKNNIKCDNYLPNIKYTGKFEGNQELVFNEIMTKIFNKESVERGKSGAIIDLQAGGGKSFLAMSLIGKLKCRTLIVCHNSGILDQWNKILKQYISGAKIGLYYGKKKEIGDITVGVINSLVMDEIKIEDLSNPRDFYDKFDFIIFDEVHEYCSESRRKIYSICQSPYMLGLSATPDERQDSLDKISKWNVGPILVAKDLEGYNEATAPFTAKVIKIKYYGDDEYTKQLMNEKLEMTSVPKMLDQLSQDPHRLQLCVDLILEQLKDKLNIFVFADRRSYLEKVQQELLKRKEESNIVASDEELKAIQLVGGSSSEDIELAKQEKNIILSTYQYSSTGLSIPKMNCMILLTPRKSKAVQIFGRIFRLGSNYDIKRIIIDIVDMKTTLKNQFYERNKYYKEKEFDMEERSIKYSDIKF